jgi:hypothetical protein
VLVAVAEVRDVEVCVEQLDVAVRMTVPASGTVVVLVVVLAGVVDVLVGERVVATPMVVSAHEREGHARCGDDGGDERQDRHRLLQHDEAMAAPMNGAGAKMTWPHAAPRSRAPFTHTVIDSP